MGLTPRWFGWLAAELREAMVAPVVYNLEGGYGPEQCGVAAGHVVDGLTGVVTSAAYLDQMRLLITPASPSGVGAADAIADGANGRDGWQHSSGAMVTFPSDESRQFIDSSWKDRTHVWGSGCHFHGDC